MKLLFVLCLISVLLGGSAFIASMVFFPAETMAVLSSITLLVNDLKINDMKNFRNNYNITPEELHFTLEVPSDEVVTEPSKSLTVKELYERMMRGQYVPEGASYSRPAEYDGDNPDKVASLDTSAREAVDMGESIRIATEQLDTVQAQAANRKKSAEAEKAADKPTGATASETAGGVSSQSAASAEGEK